MDLQQIKKRPWTRQHDQFLSANYGHADIEMIAACLKRTRYDVQQRAFQLKLHR